jgi:hypothetical protein
MTLSGNIDIIYLTLPVNNADEAVSLSEYLNQHGICAAPEGNDGVLCPVDDPGKALLVHTLRQSWILYWEHSDSGLFGLPMFIKDSAEGCLHCGIGPRVE